MTAQEMGSAEARAHAPILRRDSFRAGRMQRPSTEDTSKAHSVTCSIYHRGVLITINSAPPVMASGTAVQCTAASAALRASALTLA